MNPTNRPITMYHGTSEASAQSILDQGIDIDAERRRDPGDFGWGFYLTGDRERAARMGRVVLSVTINVARFAFLEFPYFIIPGGAGGRILTATVFAATVAA